jgi:two-component system, NtrC family, nitrogen regulation sensor histidine kinase GlnL
VAAGATLKQSRLLPLADSFHVHPVATISVDSAGTIGDANQAAEALFNRARAGLIGLAASTLLEDAGRANFERVMADEGASARLFAQGLSGRGGQPGFADIIIGPVAGDDGVRLIAFHQVPAATREAAVRPGAAARSASAAAAMLAHEIKNPLSGIRGAAQLLGRHAAEPGKPMVELICGEVDRIAALIDSMQAFTRGTPPVISRLNAFTAIGQARDVARSGFARSAEFDERFDPSIPDILGNHDALVQVMLNLIKNAAEAGRGAQRVQIRLSTAYRHGFFWDMDDGAGPVPLPVELAVLDNGPGVPANMLDALFDPFVSSKADGQGLGLALVDKLVRDMGGVVRHDRVDGWTRFRLWLRAAPTSERG